MDFYAAEVKRFFFVFVMKNEKFAQQCRRRSE